LSDVRCWDQSRKHLLAASISPFDPSPTLADQFCCDAQGILRIDNVVGSVSRLEGAHATTRIHHAAGRRGGMRASTHSDGV